MKKAQIMIVEDKKELVKLYEKFLLVNGYFILFKAYNGRDALEFYKTTKEYPDVIIMDYRMPFKDGIATSQEILQVNPNQKIIFASADESIKERAEEIGIMEFKKKPFSLVDLRKSIEKAIEMT
ncbi:MAG: response regulator [Candidatus Hodarchaeota archaeon]